MAKAKERKRQSSQWIAKTQAEAGAFFGVAVPTIQVWVKQGMPGQRGFYDLQAIYHWLKSRQNMDANSDALEMQRLEKAKILRLERLERERELVSFSAVHGYLTEFASHLREAGEQLQREFGNEAVRWLNEKLDDAVELLERAERDRNNEGIPEVDRL
jgi:phage terminase Nu1 subunit (DNA packaging protein)